MQNSLCSGQVEVLSNINMTTKFLIPVITSSGVKTSVANIFRVLELNRKKLNIREWGLTMASLEEVFVSVVKNVT